MGIEWTTVEDGGGPCAKAEFGDMELRVRIAHGLSMLHVFVHDEDGERACVSEFVGTGAVDIDTAKLALVKQARTWLQHQLAELGE